MERYGMWVQNRRKALGMSRKDVADQTNITQEYLRLIELGDRIPSAPVRHRIDKLLAETKYEVWVGCERHCEAYESERLMFQTTDPAEAIRQAIMHKDQLHYSDIRIAGA